MAWFCPWALGLMCLAYETQWGLYSPRHSTTSVISCIVIKWITVFRQKKKLPANTREALHCFLFIYSCQTWICCAWRSRNPNVFVPGAAAAASGRHFGVHSRSQRREEWFDNNKCVTVFTCSLLRAESGAWKDVAQPKQQLQPHLSLGSDHWVKEADSVLV